MKHWNMQHNEPESTKHHIQNDFVYIEMSRISQSRERERWLLVARGWARGVEERSLRYTVSFRDSENVLEMGSGDGCTTLWIN